MTLLRTSVGRSRMLRKAFETPDNAFESPGSAGTLECHEEELQIWMLG